MWPKTYDAGSPEATAKAFAEDAPLAMASGYRVGSQTWAGSALTVIYQRDGSPSVAVPVPATAAATRAPGSKDRVPARATTPKPQPVSTDQRTQALSREIGRWVGKGYRVESQDAYGAVLVTGHRVNHILHAILTIFLLGLWLFVWIPLALFGGEKRVRISVTENGDASAYHV